MNPVFILTKWVCVCCFEKKTPRLAQVLTDCRRVSAVYKNLEMKTKRSITTYNFTRG